MKKIDNETYYIAIRDSRNPGQVVRLLVLSKEEVELFKKLMKTDKRYIEITEGRKPIDYP